jgi:hypothetical protein
MQLSLSETQQQEMRHAHFDGGPGILVSGLIWFAAALVCYQLGINKAVWTLLIGGVLIHPISLLVTKALGRPASTSKTNALNQLAIASTLWLIVCCAMAYGLFLLKPALFFPAMMATIGSRYLIFASIYNRPLFWLLGLSLLVAANGALFLAFPPAVAAGLGAVIEILFAYLVFSKSNNP